MPGGLMIDIFGDLGLGEWETLVNVFVGDRKRHSSKRYGTREIYDEREWKFRGYCTVVGNCDVVRRN